MIDEKILEQLKKLDDKEKIKKFLEKRLPDIDPERFKDLERFKDKKKKKEKIPDDFFKFKEKKKRDDFFKKYYETPMPLPYDPNKKIPDLKKFGPYKIPPSDEMPGIQLLKKGGTVKGYKAGGQVKKDKSPNSGMITKRGWGASRKT